MMRIGIFIFLFYFVSNSHANDSNPNTNLFLKRYSKLTYDRSYLSESHRRARRSADEYIELKFSSHGKDFHIKMRPNANTDLFKNDQIEIGDDKISINRLNMYEGYLVGEPNSQVDGAIIDDIFIATIVSDKDGTYHIESAKRYELENDTHAIIYHEDDLNSNEEVKQKLKDILSENVNFGCGLNDKSDVLDLLNEKDKEFMSENDRKMNEKSSRKKWAEEQFDHINEKFHDKYMKELNEHHGNSRKKRQTASFPNDRRYCSLYLKVDHYMFQTIFNSEGNRNDATTADYLAYYLRRQVSTLNSIFSTIADPLLNKIQFQVYKTKIIRPSDCTSSTSKLLNSAEKELCVENLDSSTMLDLTASDNYKDYCLSFTFTSRDFAGVLGLAYPASTTASGGVCEQPLVVNGATKSLNSGVITVLSYGKRVPENLNQLTFAHEVGHSFGSQHDPDSCSPGNSNGGNYIMYVRSTDGTKTNNNKFSSCSISQISSVINNLVTSTKFCFKTLSSNICGNKIIEDSEECDCGSAEECTDTCCDSSTCKLAVINQVKVACSPSQGGCCLPNCSIATNTSNYICAPESDCMNSVVCLGTVNCPRTNPAFFKVFKNGTVPTCNSGTQVCSQGSCGGSVCEIYGLSSCQLQGNLSDATVDKAALCNLACIGPSTNNICTDSSKIVGIGARILSPGSVCSNSQGYCDVYSKCRSVNLNTTISKLAKKLLSLSSPITIQDIKTWVIQYWWAVLIFSVLFVLFNIFILVCIFRNMKSDNPHKSKPQGFRKPRRVSKTPPAIVPETKPSENDSTGDLRTVGNKRPRKMQDFNWS